VVREQLGAVLKALTAERADPIGRSVVLVRPLAARDLPVRDVADEQVEERVLALAAHR
jgi:hypothetical protein